MPKKPYKKPTQKEIKFATLLVKGIPAVQAARKAFGWKCETNTAENQKAKDLARQPRIQKIMDKIEQEMMKKAAVENFVSSSPRPDLDSLHKFAFERLKTIRDDESNPATVRFEAIKALEKLADPASDLNLIQRYVNLVWDGMTAHCPSCHKSFPLWKVKNSKLEEYRNEHGTPERTEEEEFFGRRLHLINQMEKRKTPHRTQLHLLAAPERHLIGQGPARAGKSLVIAMFGVMFFLIPGVEVWILARVYDDARSEFEYIQTFLRTAFYPVDKYMYNVTYDTKSGEASITSKWGSEIKIKSSKAQGSVTGREVEGILVAEPAWIGSELFEEVRARLSSRLGRIIALGTPKGFGGFLGRLVKMTSRDMRTGQKLPENARLISQGCPWGQSIYKIDMSPQDNPEYVQSEIEAARSELTATEFAAEFEGLMVEDTNAKFPWIKDDSLIKVKEDWLSNCGFVLGIDQGERNFASCLIAWDGKRVFVVDEFFDNTDATIKANLIKQNNSVPPSIRLMGGESENWLMTIFDSDPPIQGQLYEMEDESREWKTDYTFRPKNKKEFMNWREETCMWANELAKEGNLIFDSERCELLYEQLKDALIMPVPAGTETKTTTKKGWVINDPWRGEHVPDAWLMAMWVIYNQMIVLPSGPRSKVDAFEEHRRAFEFRRIQAEKDELKGLSPREPSPSAVHESIYGIPMESDSFMTGFVGYYPDES